MEKKYLIAVDMDGTLLNSQKQISPKTRDYLKMINRNGHKVMIATGRPVRAIKTYYNELELDTPIVCYNGVLVTNPNDNKLELKRRTFSREAIFHIINEIGLENFGNIMCENDTDIFLLNHEDKLSDFFWHDGMSIHYGDLRETLDVETMTMIIQMPDHSFDDKLIAACATLPGLKLRFWDGTVPNFSELYYDDCNKASGIKIVADFYNIDFSHTIAFGDADNDIEMLSSCGLGVAMANGNDLIKKVATCVSDFDNDHDGIVTELQKIIKL